jgi:hypothetical protein
MNALENQIQTIMGFFENGFKLALKPELVQEVYEEIIPSDQRGVELEDTQLETIVNSFVLK